MLKTTINKIIYILYVSNKMVDIFNKVVLTI